MRKLRPASQTFSPGLLIVDTSTPSIYSDVAAACDIKKRVPGLCTVLVGAHVSALPLETLALNSALDAIAFGEYEETLLALAEALSGDPAARDFSGITGIAWRDSRGETKRNEPRPYMTDLDNLPMASAVYKKHLSVEPYFYGHSRHPLIVIMTGRGCPFRCTYCVVPQVLQGHRYRRRSVASVVGEFVYIKENYPQVREIMIEDDTLTADPKRCRELSAALIEARATAIPWSANSRADVDYETMAAMRKAGCRLFCVGFESGDQEILNNIQKGTTIGKIRTFMKDAKRAGILIHGCFMVGNRGRDAADPRDYAAVRQGAQSRHRAVLSNYGVSRHERLQVLQGKGLDRHRGLPEMAHRRRHALVGGVEPRAFLRYAR